MDKRPLFPRLGKVEAGSHRCTRKESPGTRLTLGGSPHPLLNVPGEDGNDTVRRKDGSRPLSRLFFLLEWPGQSIRLGVAGTQPIGESEVEAGKENRPTGLARVQSLGSADVLKVFVVIPNQEGFLGALQPMLPLF